MKDAAGTFTGRIVDIAESGELLVAGEDGNLRRYGFREVGFGD
jgi:hypothetical protein